MCALVHAHAPGVCGHDSNPFFPFYQKEAVPLGVTASFWRRERDSNPCPGIARLPHFECGPFDLLGISPYRPAIIQDGREKIKTRFSFVFTYNLQLELYKTLDKVCGRDYTDSRKQGKG